MVAAIVKIQRTYRGCLGRRRARLHYIKYITEKREIIRGLCRCWKVMQFYISCARLSILQARRVLRIKKAELLDRKATMLQCAYRSRASRRYMAELKRKVLEKLATRLQRNLRGFTARKWIRRLWVRVEHLLVALQKVSGAIQFSPYLVKIKIYPNAHCSRKLQTIFAYRTA
jgi:hypothetical protein